MKGLFHNKHKKWVTYIIKMQIKLKLSKSIKKFKINFLKILRTEGKEMRHWKYWLKESLEWEIEIEEKTWKMSFAEWKLIES